MNEAPTKTADSQPQDFSFADPAVQSDPFAFYRALRENCPAYRVPETGFHMITRYADLRAALLDTQTFSNVLERGSVLQGENINIFLDILEARGWRHMPTLQRSDPPQHARYRKFVDRAFNMKQVRTLQGRMEKLVHEIIDRFIDRGTCNFIEEFAFPFPGTIIAELVGLDGSEWPRYRAWADNLIAYGSGRKMTIDELKQAAETELEMQHHYARIFEDRRAHPREDLMTALVQPIEGDEPLSMRELQNVMHQLTSGGYETVPSALSHGLWTMIRFPEVTEELRADRSLMRNFINECLRFESPVQGLYRMTTKDAQVGDVTIPKGAMVNVRYGAGNRDEAQFPEADRFDLHREASHPNLAFGSGPHFCPGAVLARQEMNVAYNAILDRMDEIALATPLPDPVHKPSFSFIPMKELNIRFRKIR